VVLLFDRWEGLGNPVGLGNLYPKVARQRVEGPLGTAAYLARNAGIAQTTQETPRICGVLAPPLGLEPRTARLTVGSSAN